MSGKEQGVFVRALARMKHDQCDANVKKRMKNKEVIGGEGMSALSPRTDIDTRTGSRSSSVGTMSPPSQSIRIHPARTPLLLPVAPSAAGTKSST